MMSRRFKLSNHFSEAKRLSTIDGIPDICETKLEKDQITSITNHIEDSPTSLDVQNLAPPNPTHMESLKDISDISDEETSYLQDQIIISEIIEEIKEHEEQPENITYSSLITEEKSKDSTNFNIKEDSDSEDDLLPKKGDRVKVKYSDRWYTGKVHSVSSKKKYFWVDFKGFDELYKIRGKEKFTII